MCHLFNSLIHICMCNCIKIVNLYPYEKGHYQLDYSVFIFCFQSCKLHSFPKLLKSGNLIEVVLNICNNITRLFSQILYSIFDVKFFFFFNTHPLIHFMCCKILRLLTNRQCHLFTITSYRKVSLPWNILYAWRRNWQPTPVFLPGKSQGQRSLKGYSPWGLNESLTTWQLSIVIFRNSEGHTKHISGS